MKFFVALILSITSLFATTDYSIVFVHIGEDVPDYAKVALYQARLFNPDCPIILLANQKAIDTFSMKGNHAVTTISIESLNKTAAHKKFIEETVLNGEWRDGFWRYCSERFLVLDDLIEAYALENIFHLEYDNMLYVHLEELLPIFEARYPKIGATFDNDERCIPGFVYIRNQEAISSLANCFANHARKGLNDMQVLALFKKEMGKDQVQLLPIVPKKYVELNTLISKAGHTTTTPYDYCNNLDLFDAIFDAAAIGQYLGGIDPRNGPSKPGFINESCLFHVGKLNYSFEKDQRGRKVPYANYRGEKRKIVNLHIHSKKLNPFLSR